MPPMGVQIGKKFKTLIKRLKKQRWPLILAASIAGLGVTAMLLVVMAPTILGWIAPPLNQSVDLYAVNRPGAFTFLDSDGKEVGHRGAVVGNRLKLEDMPAYLPAAFIAVEDRRFYSHHGVDIKGVTRAMLTNIRAGRWVAGGSTITQQTAKIVFTQQERTFSRKFSELINAAQLENALTKKQILELYLNRLYLGSGAFGVDGAARVYFGKSAHDVTLAEAAMLATLTRAPSVFTPRRDLAAAQERAARVLNAMVETGAITAKEAAAAKAKPATVIDRTQIDARNYYLDTAADEARSLASVNGIPPSADLIVHTTLDARLQEAARTAVASAMKSRGAGSRVSEAALVMMRPDGAVVAMVGGVDYSTSVFNRATQARRQPGSAFKPFVYLAALEAGYSPWEYRDDEPVDINGWSPSNFGNRYYGTVTLADALAHSVNTITANLAQDIGVPAVVETAHRLGIVSPLTANASLALGTSEVTPLELTTAYAAFANGGYRIYPYLVTEVDTQGGQVLYARTPPAPQRVIADRVLRDMNAMMYEVMTSGTGAGASLSGHEAGGKTGTTQDSKDAWFVGYTTDYVTGVWVGNDDAKPTRGVTGGSIPAAIWKQAMTAAEKDMPSTPLDRTHPEMDFFGDGFVIAGQDMPLGDDESSNGDMNNPNYGTPPRRSGGLFDWLFGRSDPRGNVQPTYPPDNAYRTNEPYRGR